MAATEAGARAVRTVETLYRDHVGAVYRYAYAVLGNHADAEDVTQTTFVNALRALERGEKPRKTENWLLTITHNIVRQRWRQQASRPREVELDTDAIDTPVEEPGTDLDDIVRALQRIPPSQREAIVMREIEGRSYQEIAEILDLTVSALETLLFRARRSLTEEIQNLVTCDRAEAAISRQLDGRLTRKDRRRLQEHLRECAACARMAHTQTRYRGALRGLALLPIPISVALFKGVPTASAGALPTIGIAGGTTAAGAAGAGAAGAGAAAGGSALLGGVAAKVAAVVIAGAAVGGAGYEGVTTFKADRPAAKRPAATSPDTSAPSARNARDERGAAKRTTPPAAAHKASKADRPGKSSVAPGHLKEPGERATPDRGRRLGVGTGAAKRATKPVKAAPAPRDHAPKTSKATKPGPKTAAPVKKQKTAPTPPPKQARVEPIDSGKNASDHSKKPRGGDGSTATGTGTTETQTAEAGAAKAAKEESGKGGGSTEGGRPLK